MDNVYILELLYNIDKELINIRFVYARRD